jgi:hypothetical protein
MYMYQIIIHVAAILARFVPNESPQAAVPVNMHGATFVPTYGLFPSVERPSVRLEVGRRAYYSQRRTHDMLRGRHGLFFLFQALVLHAKCFLA